ncbi:hypothetical protein HZA75_02000 [Candidatus Roizmanbacteria bacterium]|nr:hypothetical protein [Candidatus Roizmanbacteria bacterium]
MEDKFRKFSLYVLIFGVIVSLYILINSILHTSIGTKIINTPPASQFMGPNAKE